MKTIEQLLDLAKNPYYVFTKDEKAVLDDFLSKKSELELKRLQPIDSNKLSENTRVTVRNIVKKVDTYAPEAE